MGGGQEYTNTKGLNHFGLLTLGKNIAELNSPEDASVSVETSWFPDPEKNQKTLEHDQAVIYQTC